MKKVEAVFRPERLGSVQQSLHDAGFAGFTISDVRGHGGAAEMRGEYRGQAYELSVTHKLEIEIIAEDDEVPQIVEAIVNGAHTGGLGDGFICVSDVSNVYSIRAGKEPVNGLSE